MRIFIFVLLSATLMEKSQAERLTIFQTNQKLCNDLKCHGHIHTACINLTPKKGCQAYEPVPNTAHMVKSLLYGHNGVRNKLAEDWGISNMNLLHWSKDLVKLSKLFLTKCHKAKDHCKFLIWQNITIANSYYFSPYPPSHRWMGKVIRNWWFEVGYEVNGVEDLIKAKQNNQNIESFTQLIWPTTEFVGCAAAKMFHGYLATCYYHPAATGNWSEFMYGDGCNDCPDARRTCSREFTSLCGIDLVIPSGCARFSNALIAWSLLVLLACFSYLPFSYFFYN